MYEYVRGRIADRSGTSVIVDAGASSSAATRSISTGMSNSLAGVPLPLVPRLGVSDTSSSPQWKATFCGPMDRTRPL